MPAPSLPRWARRAITVPAALAAPWVLAGAAPLAVPVVLARDLVDGDGRLWRTRAYAMALAYAVAESAGVTASAGLWIAAGRQGTETDRSRMWHHTLQRAWVASILAAARTLLGLRFEVEGLDRRDDRPLIVLGRHASLPDAFLPADLFVVRSNRLLRMVVKDDLEWVPCLDIVGHRLPNAFVDRTPSDGAEAVAALARVIDGMGGRDVAVIFPEGTYPSTTARERAHARLAERSPEHVERARALRHLLPPRPAGTLALLDAVPDADVAILGHVGLEELSSMRRLARSLPLRHPVRARLWRIPRSEVPVDREGRIEWLWRRWEMLDDWVDAEVGARQAREPQEPPEPREAVA
ncbi:MAG TPA: 1-acyl-sn-glycerol-3-phosphate acyltransferase [Iamia sp.]|nr:1-acyl-sn-glycerol-3-phosphate acyltransferase [Iamia sp.]